MALKKRRVTSKDHERIAEFIRETLNKRKSDPFRKRSEEIWREVDRLVAMEAQEKSPHDGKRSDWHNQVNLGLMGDALEILASDVLRIAMPNDRSWFQPHIELPFDVDPESGDPIPAPQKERESKNGVLKSLIGQQHADTGFRDRVKLSVKEALKHGGFVAEYRFEKFPKFYGSGQLEELGAPVWVPHSMWNCYPDISESVIGTDLFYKGSMIITSSMKWEAIEQQTGWMNLDKALKKRRKGHDAQITKYWGDIYLPRADGSFFVPNRHVILVEDVMVSVEAFKLPFSPIIYMGIEKDDVRNAYFTSQLIKRSPNAKAAAHMFNKFLDATDLAVEPPISYDSSNPAFNKGNGPKLFPGSKTPSRAGAKIEVIYQPDPTPALEGYLALKQETEQGTAVDANRQGVSESVEQTATEVEKKSNRSEVRTVDLVSVLERQGLRPALYMHHEMNKKELKEYPFYNNDPHTPDFLRASGSDLNNEAKVVHFEITGARTVLGEERRQAGVIGVTQALLGTEEGQALVGANGLAQIARDAYGDVGVKDPERYLSGASFDEDNPTVPLEQFEQFQAQMQEQLQAIQEQMGKVEQENLKLNTENAKLEIDNNAREEEKKLLEEQRQLDRVVSNGKQEFERQQKRIAEVLSKFEVDAVEQERANDAIKMLATKVQGLAKQAVEKEEVDPKEAQAEINQVTSVIDAFIKSTEQAAQDRQQRNEIITSIIRETDQDIGSKLENLSALDTE